MDTISVSSYGDGSPSQANAQAAHNAASSGDTLVFPAGEATWSSALTITKPLYIVGAGKDGSGTKITTSGAMNDGVFNITNLNAGDTPVEISDFWFNADDTCKWILKMYSGNTINKLRICGNRFDKSITGIEVGNCKGVIDHNDFYNQGQSMYLTAGSLANATASWASLVPGTDDFLFIENNNFVRDANWTGTSQNSHIEAYQGGKFVIRYNTFDGRNYPSLLTYYTIGWHGNDAASLPANQAYWQQGYAVRRGPAMFEIYENTMLAYRLDTLCGGRGGSALIYNNSVTTSVGTTRITLREEEYTSAEWSPLRTEWPAEDQIHNTFIWGNTVNGNAMTSANITVTPNDAAPNEKIKEGRDYFLHEPQDSGGYEYFTAAPGATNTYPTDGDTYPTEGTMVFEADHANAYYPYSGYTYPHPLVVTAAPTDLTATQDGTSAISLSWTDASSDEDGFTIERSLNGLSGWTEIADLPADSTSYTDTGLSSGTAYYYRVAAYNEYGSSEWSDAANATTEPAPVLSRGRSLNSSSFYAWM